MTLPSFLVIGAMKSGTTSLYEDLRKQPGVVVTEKESGVLTGQHEGPDAAPSDDAIIRAYRAAFGSAPDDDTLCGEVATTYAMSPNFPDVPGRAARLLPAGLKVIYIVREPTARIVSHHHHDYSSGRLGPSIDEAVREDRRLLDYTRYASQVRPWIDTVGPENVLLVRFESYIRSRDEIVQSILGFLRAPGPFVPVGVEVHSASAGKPVATGLWGQIARSTAYRRVLRPLLPERIKRRAMASVLPQAPERPAPPTSETLALISEELAGEMQELAGLVGEEWWTEGEPRHGVRTVRVSP